MKNNLKSYTLYLLSRREYSYNELAQKLKKYTDNQDEIIILLDEFREKGWLSDRRYIENYLASKAKRHGLLKIKQNLIQKTDNIELVDEILSNSNIDEEKIALDLWQKKYGKITTADRAKQARFLQSRGFSFSIIMNVLKKVNKNLITSEEF